MIQFLEWDSNFFGYKIGKLELNTNEPTLSEEDGLEDYDLVYIFSQEPIETTAPLLDVKLVFSMTTEIVAFPSTVIEYDPLTQSYTELETLAYISGHDSRFLKDPFFGEVAFKKLYKRWIDNSINDPETIVLIYFTDDTIEGFVTFTKQYDDKASIGLIAVSPNTQGMGIGKKLLNAVEAYLGSGIKLSVSTQETNIRACKFYTSYGFNQTEKHFIYHFNTL